MFENTSHFNTKRKNFPFQLKQRVVSSYRVESNSWNETTTEETDTWVDARILLAGILTHKRLI